MITDNQVKPHHLITQSEFNVEMLKEGKMICRNTQYCKAKQVGVHNRMYGAEQMEELDAVCAVFAAEVCDDSWVVTKTMNVEFLAPILPNQIYKTYVGIEKIGNTSLAINAEIRKHSVQTEKETVALVCKTVFVRINEDGEAINISDNVRRKYGYKPLNDYK
jgi:acyl-CoA hydrolase